MVPEVALLFEQYLVCHSFTSLFPFVWIRVIRGFYVSGSVSFLCGFPPEAGIIQPFRNLPDVRRAVRGLSAATQLLLNHELH